MYVVYKFSTNYWENATALTKRAVRVDVHLISHLLVHSSVLVTEKVYAKLLLPKLSRELNEKLSFMEFGLEKC
jgi:integrase